MDADTTDTLAFVAHRIPVELHHHHAVQLVVSLDQPYPAILGGQRQERVQGFLIDAHVPHACLAEASTVLVVSIDADAAKGKALRHRLAGEPFALLDTLMSEETYQGFCAGYWTRQTSGSARFDPLALVSLLASATPPPADPDPRVGVAMTYMARHLEHRLSLREIAGVVALSESRLRHLFVRDIGIPLRTYVLWSRMKAALNGLVAQGMGLTEAALYAGFADHAHFTRTFRRMFGVSPSVFLTHSRFLQVFQMT